MPVLVLVPGDHLTIAHYGITCHVYHASSMCQRLEGAGFTLFVIIDHIEGLLLGHMLFIIIEYYILSFAIISAAVRAIS